MIGKTKKINASLDLTGAVDEKPVTILPSDDRYPLASVFKTLMETAKLAPALERLHLLNI